MISLLSRSTLQIVASLCFACFAVTAEAAVAMTKHGEREGRVIVRNFEHLVITIVTDNNRIFQFYARDVKKVTAAEKVLLSEHASLRDEPTDDAAVVVELAPGTQISPQGNPNDAGWIRVRAWGDHEGWLLASVLTDQVIFEEEAKRSDIEDFEFDDVFFEEIETLSDTDTPPNDETLAVEETDAASDEPESEED